MLVAKMSKSYRQRSSAVMRKSQYDKTQQDGSFCRYAHRICMQDRLDGFDFCIDHILQDKNAPFKPCNFVSAKSGQKCTKAAPRADKKDGYCRQHTRRASVLRYRASLKSKPKDPAQLVLDELNYYIPGSSKEFPSGPVSSISRLLDYGSGSDSDNEPPQLDQTHQGDQDSDAESVESEPEDSLKYAEVYTAEEVALITRDKLIRLQSLYINQFKRLQHLMKEKRREFLSNLKKEMPLYGPNLGRMSDSKERKRLKKLKAMVSYRKRKGHCALLHRKSKNRRIQVTPEYQGPVKEIKLPVCTFSEGEQMCTKPCVPLVKFCMEHIFSEPHQVLYKHCSKASGVCKRAAIPYNKGSACRLHQEVPPYKPRLWKNSRSQKKKDIAPLAISLNDPTSILTGIEQMDTSGPHLSSSSDLLSLPSTSKSTPTMDTYLWSSKAQQEETSIVSLASDETQAMTSVETSKATAPSASPTPAQVPSGQKQPTGSPTVAEGKVTVTMDTQVTDAGTSNQLSTTVEDSKPKPRLHDQGANLKLDQSKDIKVNSEDIKVNSEDIKVNSEETETVIDVTGISSETATERSAMQ